MMPKWQMLMVVSASYHHQRISLSHASIIASSRRQHRVEIILSSALFSQVIR
jgi:hypothetical protein